MGPKKKGKKSKAELEAEKAAKELEEQRLAAEAERKKKEDELAAEEAAKKLKEEQIQFRTDELERLKQSYEDMLPVIEKRMEKLESRQKEIADGEDWAAYTSCSYKPRVTEADLNTYITETNGRPEMSLSESLECLAYTESIIEDVNSVIIKMKSQPIVDEAKVAALSAFVPFLRTMCISKLDKATVNILQQAEKHLKDAPDGKGKEVKMAEKSGDIRYGMWVNLIRKDKFRFLDLDWRPKLGIMVTLPKQFSALEVALRAIHFPYNQISSRFGTKDLVLGGVFQLDIIHLPPMSTGPGGRPMSENKRGWVMREITEEGSKVCKSNWPMGNADGVISKAAAKIKCCIQLRDGLLLDEDLKVAWFHPVEMRWTDEPIEETEYNAETREIRFTTVSVGSIAVVQDRLMDLCYESWSLRPVMLPGGAGEVHLSIKTPRYLVTIVVGDDGLCRLASPEVEPLASLRQKRSSPGDLLYALQSAGLSLLPTKEAAAEAKYFEASQPGVTLKHTNLNTMLCDSVARLSTSFDFKSSRWSNSLGSERACLQVKETDAFTGGTTLVDYSMLLLEFDSGSSSAVNAPGLGECPGGIKASLVRNSEGPSFRAFDDFSLGQGEIHVGECLRSIATEEAMKRVDESEDLLGVSVGSLLRATGVFSFC